MTIKCTHNMLNVLFVSVLLLSVESFAQDEVAAPRTESLERPGTTASTSTTSETPVNTPTPTETLVTPIIHPVVTPVIPSVPTTPVITTPTTPIAIPVTPTPTSTASSSVAQATVDPFSMPATLFSTDELNDSITRSAALQMFSLETSQDTLGLLFSFSDLQKTAEIINAQLMFTNAHDDDYINGQLRFYAEDNANPDMFSLDNPPSQRALGKYYANYVNQYQSKQGATWRADVTAPIQALFKNGKGGQRIVLITKGMTAQAVQNTFLNYSFNENTLKLVLTLKNPDGTTKTFSNAVLTDSVLDKVVALPSVKQTGIQFTRQTADVLQGDLGAVCFMLQADSVHNNSVRAATAEIALSNSQVSFALPTGEILNTHALVQNISALQNALQSIANVQNIAVQNDGTVSVNLANGSLFVARPDLSSTPNNQLAAGLVEQDHQTFLVFYDALGVLRQQALYPVSLHPEELQTALQNVLPNLSVNVDNNGVLTLATNGQSYHVQLSLMLHKNTDNSPVGVRAVGDMNQDGKADYQITYSDGTVQVLYSL